MKRQPPTSRLPQIGETVFTRMSALAGEAGAINLSQGFPDFDGPDLLFQRLAAHVAEGRNQYAPMPGLLTLRQAIAVQVTRHHGRHVDPDHEVTVTSGATEALYAAIAAMVGPGDEAVVLDPAYDAYVPAILLNGARARRVPLEAPEFQVDWGRVSDAVTPKTRLIVINTPHNPTGRVLGADDLTQLAELVRDRPIWVLSDEVYEHIQFGPVLSSVHRHPELRARSLVVSSFGKSLHITGWKLGYCVAPAELTRELRKVHQYLTFSSFTPAQWALADLFAAQPDVMDGLADFYRAKRDLFAEALAGSGFDLLPCQGTYFQVASYARLSGLADTEFAEQLIQKAGVAAIPVSVFYEAPQECAPLVRFCFAKSDTTLLEAARRLSALR
ncbi:MAG: methionine aminotransferase [Pseudomonadota bacterium]|nr:methionine aminotransferase [Pseudomonadota bacterium]